MVGGEWEGVEWGRGWGRGGCGETGFSREDVQGGVGGES